MTDILKKLDELNIPIIEEEEVTILKHKDGTETRLGAYTINLEGVPQENITAFYEWCVENEQTTEQWHEFLAKHEINVKHPGDEDGEG